MIFSCQIETMDFLVIVYHEFLVSKFRKRLKSASVALSLLAWCVAVYAVEAFHDLATQSFEESATLLK